MTSLQGRWDWDRSQWFWLWWFVDEADKTYNEITTVTTGVFQAIPMWHQAIRGRPADCTSVGCPHRFCRIRDFQCAARTFQFS
jgi:hypothetical protein